jgi:hypothetical protein
LVSDIKRVVLVNGSQNLVLGKTMPQATDEQRDRWPGGDAEAITYLEAAGFKLTKIWTWIKPDGHDPTPKEWDAVDYLVNEWDFGGIENI